MREQYEQTIRDFLRLLEEKDVESWIDLWAEDGVNHYPYHSGLFPAEMVGKQAVYDNWKDVPGLFDSLSFPIHGIWVDELRRTAIVRFDSHNVMKGGEKRYDNTYVCIFTFDEDGKIVEYWEYFNPITTGVTYGLIDVHHRKAKAAPS
jgi:uncharacterized protein